MKVAIIGSRGYPSTYSGFETLLRRLSPFLVGQGHEVRVYCRTGRKMSFRWRSSFHEGVEQRYTPGIEGKATSTLSYGLSACIDAAGWRPDVALVLNVANGYYLPFLKARDIPTAVNVDGIEWERAKWSPLGRAVFRQGAKLSAKYADALVADSLAIKAYWNDVFSRDSSYISYGGDIVKEPGTDLLLPRGLKPGRFVLTVARMVPENRLDLLLDAFEHLPAGTELVIVGSSVGRSELEDRVRSLATSKSNVTWLGHVSDQRLLSQLWGHCGAYWHGHSVGGTNPSLLQALGHGAPVIALDTVYNREVLEKMDQVCPGDSSLLAAQLGELLADEAIREKLKQRGREIVGERYRWPDVCERYENVLSELSNHRIVV
jgi:glycosyltransferase involved in cell wall biosynthesis